MRITAKQMKESIKEIYKKLDEVSPLDYDCGKLCGEVCCVYDEEPMALYLMPGEELMYEDTDSFELYYIPSNEIDYPHTWTDDVFMVECTNPPHCDRNIRPIQCRTFPLIPHISNSKLHLILDENEFPYTCPIIEDNIKLNDEFIKVTYSVWKKLITNPVVYDLVEFDSRRRDNKRKEYKVII